MSRPRRKLKATAAAAVRIPDSGLHPVLHGHPWVFRDITPGAPVGHVVVLQDHAGTPRGWGLADEGPIAIRVLDTDVPESLDVAALVMDRVARADRLRLRLMPPETTAYRVVNGAGDGLPGLVVDRYDGLAVVRLYAAAWEPWLDEIVAAVRRTGWAVQISRRLGVKRVDGSQGLEELWGGEAPDMLVVQERGMWLLVRPHDGQKTGLFLDHREHRYLVGTWAAGRRMANLFAYNGGFSVAAALGGAARVITVDLAPEAIEDAKEVFRLNELDPDHHVFEVADVFSWSPKEPVDFVVVDPPSLARGRKDQTAARRAYRKLHARAAGWLSRDGLLGAASCTSWLTTDAWARTVEEGVRGTGHWSWLWRSVAPPDHPVAVGHPEGHYLKFGLLRRR